MKRHEFIDSDDDAHICQVCNGYADDPDKHFTEDPSHKIVEHIRGCSICVKALRVHFVNKGVFVPYSVMCDIGKKAMDEYLDEVYENG